MKAYDKISDKIRTHINNILRTTGLPENQDSIEKLAEGWLTKENIFRKQIKKLNMEETIIMSKKDVRGCLIITYSGSILKVGPLKNNKRDVEYTSIGFRNDVPSSAEGMNAILETDICIDSRIEFTDGPIQRSSPVYRIAVLIDKLGYDDEDNKLALAAQLLSYEFVAVNKTIMEI